MDAVVYDDVVYRVVAAHAAFCGSTCNGQSRGNGDRRPGIAGPPPSPRTRLI